MIIVQSILLYFYQLFYFGRNTVCLANDQKRHLRQFMPASKMAEGISKTLQLLPCEPPKVPLASGLLRHLGASPGALLRAAAHDMLLLGTVQR